jgi:hypothetical protein
MDKKPGYKTTEFWLSLAAVVVGLLFASGVVADGSAFDKVLGLAASVLGALGYSVSRAKVKVAEAIGSGDGPPAGTPGGSGEAGPT